MTSSLAHDTLFGRGDRGRCEWAVSKRPVPYPLAIETMEARVEAILAGEAVELVWLLEHPPLYTAGISAKPGDLLDPNRFPVFQSARGGQFTYHGPGQRVIYLMLDLRQRRRDARAFVGALEVWIVMTLAKLGVEGGTRAGRVGVWVEGPDESEAKIAAIGVKLRRWVSFHGVSLNVSPNLAHFDGIVPCGIREHGVTSLLSLAATADPSIVDRALADAFTSVFGPISPIETAPAP